MKTFTMWQASGVSLDKFLQVGDRTDQEMFDYFLNVLPPRRYGQTYVQLGEPSDEGPDYRPRYDTITKHDGCWVYVGPRATGDVGIERQSQNSPPAPIAYCAECGEPRDAWNVTCLRSMCQQNSCAANALRNKSKRKRGSR